MVEVSRDGRRVYITNSLYGAVDDQFYPDGMTGWMAKVDVGANGGISLDPDFFVDFGEAVSLHTLAMLAVMGLVAWLVYKKVGLAVLKKSWLNFDLIWAGALLVVGAIALVSAL